VTPLLSLRRAALGADPTIPGLVATLAGHAEIVYAVAFSPDGQRLATGSFDKSVKLWDAATGKAVRTLAGPGGHQNLVLCVAFSPDGKLLASGGADNQVRLWKLDGPPKPGTVENPVRSLGHNREVDALAFNPAGTLLAAAGHDGTVRLWDPAKGQSVREIKAHVTPAVAPIYGVAWSPDGKQLVTSSFDGSLKLWDAGNGTLVREFKGYKVKESEKGHREGVFCAAFSPDGRHLASGGSDRCLKLWNVADGTVIRDFVNPAFKSSEPQAHPGWVYGLRFTPDGRYIISGGNARGGKGHLAVWDAADGKQVRGEDLPVGTIHGLALSPDGKRVALACGPRNRQSAEGNAYVLRLPEPAAATTGPKAK
jgi:WD40 repeat protein